jgi:hypothetical protein
MYPQFVIDKSEPNVTQLLDIDHDKYIDLLEGALGLTKQ